MSRSKTDNRPESAHADAVPAINSKVAPSASHDSPFAEEEEKSKKPQEKVGSKSSVSMKKPVSVESASAAVGSWDEYFLSSLPRLHLIHLPVAVCITLIGAIIITAESYYASDKVYSASCYHGTDRTISAITWLNAFFVALSLSFRFVRPANNQSTTSSPSSCDNPALPRVQPSPRSIQLRQSLLLLTYEIVAAVVIGCLYFSIASPTGKCHLLTVDDSSQTSSFIGTFLHPTFQWRFTQVSSQLQLLCVLATVAIAASIANKQPGGIEKQWELLVDKLSFFISHLPSPHRIVTALTVGLKNPPTTVESSAAAPSATQAEAFPTAEAASNIEACPFSAFTEGSAPAGSGCPVMKVVRASKAATQLLLLASTGIVNNLLLLGPPRAESAPAHATASDSDADDRAHSAPAPSSSAAADEFEIVDGDNEQD